MSKFIGDTTYNGTLERSIALVLDYNLISAGMPDNRKGFYLLNEKQGIDAVTKQIADVVKAQRDKDEVLKGLLAAYLTRPSSDGSPVRQKLRAEMAKLL